ncbi:MAG: DUF1841 family protein [Thiothrix sp.]|nr:DUF1841 family protein [Thiothrix sp.]HPQ94569.1 DUF1841 family protein [Thiolinea sp.]
MPGQSRDSLRRFYLQCWSRFQEGVPLSPLEQQVAQVITEHPEYHHWLREETLEREFPPEQGENNPFLHMGLHLGLREQVATDRPAGIRAIYLLLQQKHAPHEAEHRMLECLAEALWQAQRDQRAPDEQAYLEQLQRLTD